MSEQTPLADFHRANGDVFEECQGGLVDPHFGDPAGVLDLMRGLVNVQGRLMITFGPPWLAPYGAHMHFFTKLPWVHLLFSEQTVLRVRELKESRAAACESHGVSAPVAGRSPV